MATPATAAAAPAITRNLRMAAPLMCARVGSASGSLVHHGPVDGQPPVDAPGDQRTTATVARRLDGQLESRGVRWAGTCRAAIGLRAIRAPISERPADTSLT
jgi:hypothetical protein